MRDRGRRIFSLALNEFESSRDKAEPRLRNRYCIGERDILFQSKERSEPASYLLLLTSQFGFSYYQLLLSALDSFSWKSYFWQPGGIGLGGLEGGGENPIPKAREFPPQWPGASPLLASITLSQEALRLPIITFPAETAEEKL